MTAITYNMQDRGDADAYASYFAGMDRSMRQKVALITSYIPTSGTVADMGSGSGSGSFDLASLYPGLNIVGIDINPKAIEYSKTTYVRPNLSYQIGDIAQPVFEQNSLSGILNSSVLHHVTSFNNFSLERIFSLLDAQTSQLRENGIIAIRDFVIPDGSEDVYLQLPANDGAASGPLPELSSAALFELFTQQFRCRAYPHGGIPLQRVDEPRSGFHRYRTTHRLATEFVLRKDYRHDWDTEILEEYTYFSKGDFEHEFAKRGLRVLLSRQLFNPWIVQHRFIGKFKIFDLNNNSLPYPPTNYIIIGEKTSCGVSLRERRATPNPTPQFLKLDHYLGSGHLWDLVSRPHPTIDIVPWYRLRGDIFVLCRQGYPRPICNCSTKTPLIDGTVVSGYINEPLSALVTPDRSTAAIISKLLSERAGITAADIIEIREGLSYFPSPGGINEQVLSFLVEISPPDERKLRNSFDTGFSSPGVVRPLSATQTLRAYQVGGMLDSRLETNIYALLHGLVKPPGPWIGAELDPSSTPTIKLALSSIQSIDQRERHREFIPATEQSGFLQVLDGEFEELNGSSALLASRHFEYVIPRSLSTNTVSLIPYVVDGTKLFIGVELRDLPAAQLVLDNSLIMTIPAWRLATDVHSIDQAKNYIRVRAVTAFGLTLGSLSELGGPYYPTIGATPEVVFPFFAKVIDLDPTNSALLWLDAEELLDNLGKLNDGHLFTALFRLAHAFYGDTLFKQTR